MPDQDHATDARLPSPGQERLESPIDYSKARPMPRRPPRRACSCVDECSGDPTSAACRHLPSPATSSSVRTGEQPEGVCRMCGQEHDPCAPGIECNCGNIPCCHSAGVFIHRADCPCSKCRPHATPDRAAKDGEARTNSNPVPSRVVDTGTAGAPAHESPGNMLRIALIAWYGYMPDAPNTGREVRDWEGLERVVAALSEIDGDDA